MKLAEALILRAEQQRRIQQLNSRANRNAKIQEGNTPAEDANALLRESVAISLELVALVQRINRTNVATPLDGHGTLADAIAERDGLRDRANAHRGLADAALVTQNAVSRSEIRFLSTVNIAELQRTADSLSRAHRELDAQIQALNWTTELLD